MTWSPESWKTKKVAQDVAYDDPLEVAAAVDALRVLPPLVTSWEIDRLRGFLADAQAGTRFLLQGGDCAETMADCRAEVIVDQLKILLQMSLVLIHGGRKPIVRIGRFAGQYAKPRSSPIETRGDLSLPSYFGDLVNRPAFNAQARRADPRLMVDAYHHSALTLNFIRSLSAGGFADLHHPEAWDLAFLRHAALDPELRSSYERTCRQLGEALGFMEALGEVTVDQLTRVDFFTSHEGLNLHYESAQTRHVPRREGHWNLTAHLPWIGERTRALDGAHVEFFRGIRNPVGVKLGPKVDPAEVVALLERLNPADERGRMVLITRMGASQVEKALPPMIEAVRRSGRSALWVCDPMHGNGITTAGGIKTRSFDDVLGEVERSFDVHAACGTILGGVHFELTGADVTECIGGASGVREEDLGLNYASACDPRLNYAQAMEMAFRISRRMAKTRRLSRPPRAIE
jgi:3-deoxy-7-phosphoheptulonate synthase